MDERFYGLTFKSLRQLAYEYATLNNVEHPFDNNTKLAGKDWAYKFVKKYGLSLRTPNPTSLARIMGFNKTQVDIFFANLEKLYKQHTFPPGLVYNMDESGISTVPNKIPKVISTKGKKLIGKISSAERGQLVTIVCAMSASGSFVPPVIIFPRQRMKNELMDGSPPGSLGMCSDSGYINSSLFIDWLKHFQQHVRADKDHPVLLILDNHSSHRSLQAIEYCKENFIHLLTIPPHSSHRLQPLDRCYFKPLKVFYAEECDRWLTNNPGRQITHFQIAGLLGRAYERCSTMEKGVKSFEKCGIYPINRNVFTEVDFLPSSVTERHEIPQESVVQLNDSSDSDPEFSIPLSKVRKFITNQVTPEKHQGPKNSLGSKTTDNVSLDDLYPPSTSRDCTEIKLVSPQIILPLPRRSEDQQRKRKGQKSEILSSTPFKDSLVAEMNQKLKKSKHVKKKIDGILERSNYKTANEEKDKKQRNTENHKKKGKKKTAEIVACPACEEEYIDPPAEDWIECGRCSVWWHEQCTAYENKGPFICDICVN